MFTYYRSANGQASTYVQKWRVSNGKNRRYAASSASLKKTTVYNNLYFPEAPIQKWRLETPGANVNASNIPLRYNANPTGIGFDYQTLQVIRLPATTNDAQSTRARAAESPAV
ncbi:unnamed protein product, partial [Trichogramma brassicae]